jgi:SAM-dependent methyltransferase
MKSMAKQAIKTLGKLPGFDRLLWHGGQYLDELESGYLSSSWQSSRINGHFTNAHGEKLALVSGLRDQIKPNWRVMFEPEDSDPLPSEAVMRSRLDSWRSKFQVTNSFLDTFGLTIADKTVLEIGAYDGVTAYTLAASGAASVTGIDIAAYYINQAMDEEINQESIARKNRELEDKRNGYRHTVGEDVGNKVVFGEDDICSSSIPSESVDVIFSWEVMEHVGAPAAAFNEMYRMLKPGGFVFHEYNPFFSINGGHSLCTLDFLWGHARLAVPDFERYLDEIRPAEKGLALAFYHNNLNRMTLSDLQRYIADAGFTPLSVLPWSKRKHLELVTKDILKQCTAVYPQSTLADMISPVVWVLLQK